MGIRLDPDNFLNIDAEPTFFDVMLGTCLIPKLKDSLPWCGGDEPEAEGEEATE